MTLILSSLDLSEATIASPHSFEAFNEDGSSAGMMRVIGGPKEHYTVTEDGYTVCSKKLSEPDNVFQRKEGQGNPPASIDGPPGQATWFYCEPTEDGDLKPRMDMPIGKSDPESAGLGKGLKMSKDKAEEKCGKFCTDNDPGEDSSGGEARHLRGQETRRLQGTLKNLVVIFKFSNHASRTVPSRDDIDTLMHSDRNVANIAPTGSVKQVFLDNSDGMLVLDSTVAAWVTLDSSYTETACAAGQDGLTTAFHPCLRNALNKVDALINFNNFDQDNNNNIDAITFLHSGYGAEWGKSNDCQIQRLHSTIWVKQL